jgi:peptidoglycan/LPS O-acetylase OafA/YrhL
MLIPRIYALIKFFPFEFMTIGAIGGYLYAYYKEKIEEFSKSKFLYLIVLGFVFFLLFFLLDFVYFQGLTLGFLFLFLILITISEENSIVFRNKPLSYLGKISYGIYMYHPFVMFLVFPFANSYFKDCLLEYNLFVYFFVFSITILLSHLSYKYFESVFIKIKDTKYKSF